MGARTDAARTEVVAARQALATEAGRMETATREAVDIPAKIRRAPARSAALAGGAAFVVLGGPRRIVRRLRRAVGGEPAPLPSEMLPKEIDKAIRSLGSDGEKVRGALERSFANYLAKNGKYTDRSVRGATEEALATAIRTAGRGIGLQVVKRALTGEFHGGRQRLRPDAPDHPARHDGHGPRLPRGRCRRPLGRNGRRAGRHDEAGREGLLSRSTA